MKSGLIKKLIVLILVFDLIMIVYLSNKKPAVSVENAQLDLLPNIRFGLDLLPSSTINIFSVFEIPTGTPEKTEEPDKEDGSRIMIDVWDEETGASEMELEEYVFHVLAGEMPASYEPEALKAQAVAARTFSWVQAARADILSAPARTAARHSPIPKPLRGAGAIRMRPTVKSCAGRSRRRGERS